MIVTLYYDDEGEMVNSLVLIDKPRQAEEADPLLAGISHFTHNHAKLWQAICTRTEQGQPCTRSLLRDELRALGMDVAKKFTRWMGKLEKDGLICIDGEVVIPITGR